MFGSSLVDNGNNNFLQTRSRADFLPYGIDFPGGPSGRFTNGKNVVDLIGDHLHLPPIPPFSSPSTKGTAILRGVDFASGGSGILDNTGSFLVSIIFSSSSFLFHLYHLSPFHAISRSSLLKAQFYKIWI